MLRKRIIPCILVKNLNVVKGINFKDHIYIGNAINIVKIFSDKKIDEICVLSVGDFLNQTLIKKITSECSVPFSVGGKIRTEEEIAMLIRWGAEKVVLNSVLYTRPMIVKNISRSFGVQSLVACLDYKLIDDKYVLFSHNGSIQQDIDVFDLIRELESLGIGEIILQSIDREGTFSGCDLVLINRLSDILNIPLGVSGGFYNKEDIISAFTSGVDSIYIGSMFIFKNNNRRSILVNVLDRKEIDYATMSTMFDAQ